MLITIIPKNHRALASVWCSGTDTLTSDSLKTMMEGFFPNRQKLSLELQVARNISARHAENMKGRLNLT